MGRASLDHPQLSLALGIPGLPLSTEDWAGIVAGQESNLGAKIIYPSQSLYGANPASGRAGTACEGLGAAEVNDGGYRSRGRGCGTPPESRRIQCSNKSYVCRCVSED